MELATSSMISEIDEYLANELGIPVTELMKRSGVAVANAIRKNVSAKKKVVFLVGKGNNGGDAYAAAANLVGEYELTVYDMFSAGQKSDAGRHFLNSYKEKGGKIVNYIPEENILADIGGADCIVDAVFGTGFKGEIPETLLTVSKAVNMSAAKKIAIDVPLGVNADNGSVNSGVIKVDITVALSFIKPGLISYPAKEFVGRIIYDDLMLYREKIVNSFHFKHYMLNGEWAEQNLPKRKSNSNKGTFGKALLITGSEKYRGAAHLSLEAALRGGAGLVTFFGDETLNAELRLKYPEAIYKIRPEISSFCEDSIKNAVELSKSHTVTLIGSGSENTDGLLRLTLSLLSSDGGTLIIDADAINALASIGADGISALRNAKRKVVLTPHPLEFSRLIGKDVSYVNSNRIELTENFARENGVILLLKGAASIISDGDETYINPAECTALAKAGSGDVLAGLIASLCAQMEVSTLKAVALAVYYHLIAAESLADKISAYGVTPSDLPLEICRHIRKSEKGKK